VVAVTIQDAIARCEYDIVRARPFGDASISVEMYLHDLAPHRAIDEMLGQAALLDQAGFDGITLSELHAGRRGYLPCPILAASWILAATQSVWVAPCPVLLPLRPVGMVAEEIGWLAASSPGRVGVGFGPGYWLPDFEVAEADHGRHNNKTFATSLRRVAAALRGDLDSGPLALDSAIRACAVDPVPCVSTADGPIAASRAARAGVGLITRSIHDSPGGVIKLVERYRAQAGAGPIVIRTRCWLSGKTQAAMERDAQATAERLVRLVKQTGSTAINLKLWNRALPPEESLVRTAEMRDQIAVFGDCVLPMFHDLMFHDRMRDYDQTAGAAL
jgi:alkanesulfonate monooxygenase SsuD/methylene tetrahydromethanopterin reductase-like flavin-dependent oxidoreductase (luciferase family)